jgi:drug/metabolite transporter (DMT)-like permease
MPTLFLFTMTARREHLWIGPLCAGLGAVGFSAKAIFIKLAYAQAPIDALTLLALRMLFSLPLFLLLGWWATRRQAHVRLTRRDWLILVWLAFTGYYVASYLDFWGLQYISAGLERLILFLHPTFVVLISAAFFRRRVTGRELGALLLCYAGIVLVFAHDLAHTAQPQALWLGAGLVLASAVSYSLYLIGNGEVVKRVGAARLTGYVMSLSSAFVLAQFLSTRPLTALAQPGSVYALVVAMALFATVLPVWLTAEGIHRMGAKAVSIFGSVGPVLTIAFGAVFLGEPVTLRQLAGAALILAGVLLVTLKPGRREPRPPEVLE